MMTALVTATPQDLALRAGPGAAHKTKDRSPAAPAGAADGASLTQLAFSGFLKSFSNGLSETAHAAPPQPHDPDGRPRDVTGRRERDTPAAPAIAPRERPDAPAPRPIEDTRPIHASDSRRSPATASPARPTPHAATADAGATRPLTAQVTQESPVLVSQPASALSARAAVATQTQATSSAPANAAAHEGTAQAASAAAQQASLHQHPKGRTGNAGSNGQSTAAPVNAGAKIASGVLTSQAVGATQGIPAPAAGLANAGQNVPAARTPILPPTANAELGGASPAAFNARRVGGPPPLPRPPLPVPPRPVTNQVSVQIQKAIGQGVDQIRIQLKPADLGRVDVKLDVAPDGRVNVAVSVENPDTLDLLQRDARALQNALHDAGLRADSDSLQFALKGHGKDANGDEKPSTSDETGTLADQQEHPDQPTGLALGQSSDGRIDIEV